MVNIHVVLFLIFNIHYIIARVNSKQSDFKTSKYTHNTILFAGTISHG